MNPASASSPPRPEGRGAVISNGPGAVVSAGPGVVDVPGRAPARGARQRSPAPRAAQRGAALLTAMIIVTLIATLSASMVWQQWRAVQVEIAERARTQSGWILSGALDWARLILREDARARGAAGIDHLGEPWATPLAEARLSTFLAADRTAAQDGPDAFLSGAITDAQSRYNLNNLLVLVNGKVDPAELETLKRLCDAAGTAPDVAERIARGLLAASSGPDASDAAAPLLPQTPEQLVWLGLDADAVRAISPYVVLLPTSPPAKLDVNANTAPREVLYAVVKKLELATAERMVQLRQRKPFESLEDLHIRSGVPKEDLKGLSVSSSFFHVRGRLRLEDRVLEQVSLIQRTANSTVILRRERISSRDPSGS